MNPTRQITALAIAFTLAGAVLLMAGSVKFFEARAFVRTARTAAGRVVDFEYRSGGAGKNRSDGYRLTVTFPDDAGQLQTVRLAAARKSPPPRIGDAVVIHYQPDSPQDARIRAFHTIWLAPTLLGCFGLAFLSASSFAFAARKTYKVAPMKSRLRSVARPCHHAPA